MTEKEKKTFEVASLAEAIHVCADAVEVAGLGKLIYKMDDTKVGFDPTNNIVNTGAMSVFAILLQAKAQGMYDLHARLQAEGVSQQKQSP